jgi:hypothetical protein
VINVLIIQDVDEEIKAHTSESLVLLLAIGPRGCSFQKLRCKIQIVAAIIKSLYSCELDVCDETVWELLSSAKNRTLWIKKRKYCITTELGAKVYYRLLEKISEKSAKASKFIDQLHGMSISDLHLLAGWFARTKSVDFLNVNIGDADAQSAR